MKKSLFFLLMFVLLCCFWCMNTASNTAGKINTYTVLSNGDDYNYTIYDVNGSKVIKIEDLATILSGTDEKFDVSRDGEDYIIKKNTAYMGSVASVKDEKAERPFYETEGVNIISDENKSRIEAYDIDGGRYFEINELSMAIGLSTEWNEDEAVYTFKKNENSKCAYISPTYIDQAKEIVMSKAHIVKVDPNKPMIALTFDDGPKAGSTERIVEALKKTNSRATFFVVGQMVEKHPELVKLAYDAGCQIGNHTFDHENLVKISAEAVKSEIFKTSNLVYDITGEYTMVGRPPYGSINDNVRNCISIPWFNWNIDTLDWKNRDADYIKNYVLEHASDGSVILMHDLHPTTADAMVTCIPELVNKGFQLVTMDELVKYKYDGDVTKVPGYIK